MTFTFLLFSLFFLLIIRRNNLAGINAPLDGDDFVMIRADDTVPSNADYAVKIQGDSMYPYISDGEIVYVKKTEHISTGEVGIFCVDGAMYCKQFFIDTSGNLTLVSANPDLKDTNIHISASGGQSVKCFGKVLLDQKISLPSYAF